MTSIRRALTVAALASFALSGLACAGSDDPRVPPGRDPGGFPVALVGAGIDYTKSDLAQRLARDGEGEIIGYDFIDDDRRPFNTVGDNTVAEIVSSEGQATTLIIVRANMADVANASRAIRYVAATPGKICLLADPITDKARAALVSAAAASFKALLFIAPVSDAENASRVMKLPNLILVSAAAENSASGDLAAPVDALPSAAPPSALAAARIAALAARLQAVEPQLGPSAMKDRILAIAQPAQENPAGPRFMAEPRRHFWLE